MITILIHTDTRYPVNRKVVKKAVSDTFKKNKAVGLDAEVSVAVVGSRKMRILTSEYLKDDKDHEILTFGYEEITQHKISYSGASQGYVNPPDEILKLGDIVLCWPYLLKEASRDDMMVDDKLYNLVCHGVEHLLGITHE
ncbi:rRNA maturation RNase YbeY [Candidatus Curtissbacteria bacterium RBG_13_35_7]|uniref:rRNA maturation RNase YbeY n=1 Tax=Candidatus Curtissbacteria bacterium RBG_13_35_7 TaxID=1797705 RepID=A0A1F5G2W8_9BACT|nr:MAG: rRNA maturation RNase YbeY [Candidatus Curtissbacteria bacterium RBG_13_35_7]